MDNDEKKMRIAETLGRGNTEEEIRKWNEYADKAGDPRAGHIEPMKNFEKKVLELGWTVTEVVEKITAPSLFGKPRFKASDRYFMIDPNGSVYSLDIDPIGIFARDAMADYCLKHNDDLGDERIRKILES